MQYVEISVQCVCLLWSFKLCYILVVVYQDHPEYGLTITQVTISQMVVFPNWVGHSCVTSAHFSLTTCSALWLLASVQVDCISLTAVLILDMAVGTVEHEIR